MSMSLSEIVAFMRENTKGKHQVDMSIAIHSQKRMDETMAPYLNSAYFAFGSLHYVPGAAAGPLNQGPRDYLRGDSVKAVSNGTRGPRPTADGDYQSFLVTQPAMQMWEVRIDPSLKIMGPAGSMRTHTAPKIVVTRAGHPSISVELVEDQQFARGVGPDPAHPEEKALYSVVFGDATSGVPAKA